MDSHTNSVIAAICLAALAAGCGGGDAPTDPAPARTTLTIDFGFIEVLEDCDGIEGDGDFTFDVSVFGIGLTNDRVYSQSINLGPGGKTADLGRRSYTVDEIDGATINVEFSAVELDRTIIGEVYNDERLAIAVTRYSHRLTDGAWSGLGQKTLSLGGGGCRVRLSWTAES